MDKGERERERVRFKRGHPKIYILYCHGMNEKIVKSQYRKREL